MLGYTQRNRTCFVGMSSFMVSVFLLVHVLHPVKHTDRRSDHGMETVNSVTAGVFSRNNVRRNLLSRQVDHLMALLPGVNVTNVISNAPGVLVRGVGSLPAKVRLQQ